MNLYPENSEADQPPHKRPSNGLVALLLSLIGNSTAYRMVESANGWGDINKQVIGLLIGLAVTIVAPILALISLVRGERPRFFAVAAILAESYVVWWFLRYNC